MEKTPTKMQMVDIEDLIPYINNARTHDESQIAELRASIREFGMVSPALIDNDKNIIVGHGRIEAARREGKTQFPCVFVEHLTDAQRKAYIIADNRLAEKAGWDMELLKVELEALNEAGFDVDITGFFLEDFMDEVDHARDSDGDTTPPSEARFGSWANTG